MKAAHKELLDRSVAAMAAAIEAYNKPVSRYRAESFTILAINAWELLLKARWLKKNANDMRSLYIRADNLKPSKGRRNQKYKKTPSSNYMTHGINHLLTHLGISGDVDPETTENLRAVIEIRDTAVHLFNRNLGTHLELVVQEIGMACVHNYTIKCRDWFNKGLDDFDTFLMPLAFMNHSKDIKGALTSKEVKLFSAYIGELCRRTPSSNAGTAITINLSFKVDRRNEPGAALFRQTNDPNAPRFGMPIHSESQVKTFYLCYESLTTKCRAEIPGFRIDAKYHQFRRQLAENSSLAWKRPNNPTKQNGKCTLYFSEKMFEELAKRYAG